MIYLPNISTIHNNSKKLKYLAIGISIYYCCIMFSIISILFFPAKHIPAKHIPAKHIPAKHIPTCHIPANHMPTFFAMERRSQTLASKPASQTLYSKKQVDLSLREQGQTLSANPQVRPCLRTLFANLDSRTRSD
jgi:hypothetical protein